MRAGAIWVLSFGLLGAATSVHAAPPEGPSESDPPPSCHDLPRSAVACGPIEVPHTGAGRIVGGSLALAGGAGFIAWGSVLIGLTTHDPSDQGFSISTEVPAMVVGFGLLATGGALLGTGLVGRRTYREWEREQAPRIVPPRGDGMLGAGVTLMITGVAADAFVLGYFTRDMDLPGPVAAFTTGVVATLGGVGLVIGSRFLRRKHMRWQASRVTPLVSPLPGARPGIGGLSFGFAGRF